MAIVAVLIFMYFGPRLKGSLHIYPEKTAYVGGEMVSGKFELTCKKEVVSNKLYASVYAEKQQTSFSSGDKQKTWVKIYENQQTIEKATTYPAGHNKTYKFGIALPKSLSENKEGVFAAIDKAKSMLFQDKVRWWLEVRLDAKGLDLSKKQGLVVSFA
ncbi:MAG: hypothetical protein ACP5E4_00630 [Candidatus Aenigmatarchaeota archaeon]